MADEKEDKSPEDALLRPPTTPERQTSVQQTVLLKLAETIIAKDQLAPTREYIRAHVFWPPPLFVILVCVFQVILFFYWASTCPEEVDIWTFCAGCYYYVNRTTPDGGFHVETLERPWLFHPSKKEQLWRFVSYAFVHIGLWHLISNVVVTLIVGIPLEIVHRMSRIGSLYFLAIIFGIMLSYIFHPASYGAGSSAAVYALLATLVANLVINWNEVPWKKARIVFIVVYLLIDTFMSVVLPAWLDSCVIVEHTTNLGGAITGFLYGIYILRNIVEREWERRLRRVCLVLYGVLFTVAVFFVILIRPYSTPVLAAAESYSGTCDPTVGYTSPIRFFLETTGLVTAT